MVSVAISISSAIIVSAATVGPTAYGAEMPPAWPEDEYLLQVGRVVYSVASLEGLLVFDLPRMPLTVEGLSPNALAGKTTTVIGRRLRELSATIPNRRWQDYLSRGGVALEDLGPKRNSVLHARPATVDGEQRIHRWRLEPTEIMSISLAHLDHLLDEIEVHRRDLNHLRPPIR
ncbi:hypothetical protein [Gemmatimonas sp.]|uniref:hypothetical protein n=1 Tax=Gemmatimonas sp. TaxID=1962908 RepID=UPI00356AD99C